MPRIKRIEGNLYQFKSPANQMAIRATADALFTKGLAAEERGDMDAALEVYQQVLNYDPCATNTLVNLGTILFFRRNFIDAEKYYREALEIDPKYALAHFNLANVLDEKGLLQEAVRHYLEALMLNSRYANTHYNLAHLYDRLGEYRLAVKHYRLYLQYQNNDYPYQSIARREIRRLQVRDLTIMPKPAASNTSRKKSGSKVARR